MNTLHLTVPLLVLLSGTPVSFSAEIILHYPICIDILVNGVTAIGGSTCPT
jgi:hypothetical protein